MKSFKSGSGNLDFGGNESDEEETEPPTETTEHEDHVSSGEQSESKPSETSSSQTERSSNHSDAVEKYPYFVRRNNVGDERDNRLEIHVRDKVTQREAEFRSELAAQLGVSEIPKTDAREFALLDAYHHPERIADRMREEGFGELE